MFSKRPESPLAVLKSLAEFILMLFGIIGIAVEIFNDQGLLKQFLNRLLDAALLSSLTAILLGLIAAVLGRLCYKRIFASAKNINRLGDFLMRAMMLTGAWFLYLYFTTGSFKI